MIHETYCTYPFDALAVKRWQQGLANRVTPCCNMKNGRDDDNDPMNVQQLVQQGKSLEQIFHSKQFNKLRSDLLNGIKNDACEYCWRLESRTGHSPRTVEIEMLEEPVIEPKLERFDTMLDENCNLRCRMCTPACSNSLRKDITLINKQGLTVPEYMVSSANSADWDPQGTKTFKAPNDDSQQELISLAQKHLKELKFTGGEPTTSPTFWKIIDNIENPQDIILNITTNGTKFNDRFITAIKRFRKNKITVSIDGTRNTYEYIRYPFQWRKLEQNVELLCDKMEEGRLELMFCGVLTIYNLLNIRNLIDWIHQHNMDTVHPIHFSCIVDPHPVDSCLDVKWASKELLDIAYKNITAALEAGDPKTEVHTKRIQTYLKWCLETEFDEQQVLERRQKLKTDTMTLDTVRNQSYKDILYPQIVNFIDCI